MRRMSNLQVVRQAVHPLEVHQEALLPGWAVAKVLTDMAAVLLVVHRLMEVLVVLLLDHLQASAPWVAADMGTDIRTMALRLATDQFI